MFLVIGNFALLLTSKAQNDTTARTAFLTLNQMPPYLFFLELLPYQARGKLIVSDEGLMFVPKDCYPEIIDGIARFEGFPCNNHLIKSVHLPFSEVSSIRRGYRLGIFIPNMLVVKDKQGRKYRFQLWGRGRLVRLVRSKIT